MEDSLGTQFKSALEALQNIHDRKTVQITEEAEKWRQTARSIQNEKTVSEAKLQQAIAEREEIAKRLQSSEIQYLHLLEKYNSLKRTTEQLQMLKTSIASLVEAKENKYNVNMQGSDEQPIESRKTEEEEDAEIQEEANKFYEEIRGKLSNEAYVHFAENIKKLNQGQSIDTTLREVKRILSEWPDIYVRFKNIISNALINTQSRNLSSSGEQIAIN